MAYYGQPAPGYGQPQRPPVDPMVMAWFQAVDADRSGKISALELQQARIILVTLIVKQALTNNDWSRFSISTCYSMIALFDRDLSGTIDIYEFSQLWGFINQWRQVFNSFDQDRSGTINHQELHTAVTRIGYNVSPAFIGVAMFRYDFDRRGSLSFEGFIGCCMLIQALTYHFQQRDTQRTGRVQFNYDDFMYSALLTLK